VMQTSLAVRDTWLIVSELLVFVIIYFVTLLAVLGNFDARLLVPFLGWVALYILALYYFVPRLGRVARLQADARSLMTGRMRLSGAGDAPRDCYFPRCLSKNRAISVNASLVSGAPTSR